MPAVDLADSIIESAGLYIAQYSAEAASRELPWDGYGGLVRICDDDSLREQGVVRAVARRPKTLLQGDVAVPDRQLDASGAALSRRDSPPEPLSRPAAAEPGTQRSTAPPAGQPGSAVARPDSTAQPEGATRLAANRPPSPPTGPQLPLPPTPAPQPPASATGCPTAAGSGGAAAPASSTSKAAPRRIPSWVQEYVLSSTGASGDKGDASNGSSSGGSGLAAAGPAADVGVPPAGVTTGGGGPVAPPPTFLSAKQPQMPQQQQQQQHQLHHHLQQLHHLQHLHHKLLQQQQQQRPGCRSAATVGDEPDLSWLAQLPTPPPNKPAGK